MTFRNELIQVAAVAIAIVQDLDTGTTEHSKARLEILLEVGRERLRQENKWGPQHHTPEEWLAILAEEVGEAARATPSSGDPRIELMIHRLEKAETVARQFLAKRFGS